MLGTRWWSCILCVHAAELSQLRGLQAAGFVPRCRPGFEDVSNGEAYDWACAFHCPGGPFATAQCGCACLSESQREIRQNAEPLPPSARGSGILLTTTPEPSPPPPVPIIELPIGGLGQSSEKLRPPRGRNFTISGQETPTSEPEVEPRDGLVDLVILCCSLVLLSGSAAIVSIALWKGFQKKSLGSTKRKLAWSDTPLPLHLPKEKCPQPSREEKPHKEATAASEHPFAVPEKGDDLLAGRDDIDELQLSSTITQKCDAKGTYSPERAHKPASKSEQPWGTKRRPSLPPVVKISHPVLRS